MKKLLFSSLLIPSIALASDEATLETVNVTAKGFENSLNTGLRDYHVIEVDELNSQAQTLGDIISQLPGVYTGSYSSRGRSQFVSIDGLPLDKTLVLINGQQVWSATLGQSNLHLIPVQQVERIEVLKGSGSLLYGSSAMAGVINIVTKTNQNTRAYLSYGSENTSESGVEHSQVFYDILETGFTWNAEKTEGISARKGENFDNDNDGFNNQSITAYANFHATEDLILKTSALRSSGTSEFDTSSTFSPEDEKTYKNTQFLTELAYTSSAISSSIKASRQIDLSATYGGGTNRSDAQRYTTISDNLGSQFKIGNDQAEIIFGADWKEDYIGNSQIQSNFTEESIINRSGFALTTFKPANNVTISAGSRRDSNSAYGVHLTYSAAAQLDINQHSVTLAQETGFIAPSFNDLYSPFGGNPDLQPQNSKTKSVKYNYTAISHSFIAKMIRHDIDNEIKWLDTGGGNWDVFNITSNVESTQLSWLQDWNDDVSTRFNMEKTISKIQDVNRRFALQPDYSMSGRLNYNYNGLAIYSQANYIGERQSTSPGERFAPYTTYDIGISGMPMKRLTASVAVSNIFDREYDLGSNYVSKPLTAKATASYQF